MISGKEVMPLIEGGKGIGVTNGLSSGAWAATLVHISEIAPNRIGAVSDVLNEGDEVKVKVLGIDDRGKIKLSMKVVNQETGEDISKQAAAS